MRLMLWLIALVGQVVLVVLLCAALVGLGVLFAAVVLPAVVEQLQTVTR